jgi:hypothetical protein
MNAGTVYLMPLGRGDKSREFFLSNGTTSLTLGAFESEDEPGKYVVNAELHEGEPGIFQGGIVMLEGKGQEMYERIERIGRSCQKRKNSFLPYEEIVQGERDDIRDALLFCFQKEAEDGGKVM